MLFAKVDSGELINLNTITNIEAGLDKSFEEPDILSDAELSEVIREEDRILEALCLEELPALEVIYEQASELEIRLFHGQFCRIYYESTAIALWMLLNGSMLMEEHGSATSFVTVIDLRSNIKGIQDVIDAKKATEKNLKELREVQEGLADLGDRTRSSEAHQRTDANEQEAVQDFSLVFRPEVNKVKKQLPTEEEKSQAARELQRLSALQKIARAKRLQEQLETE